MIATLNTCSVISKQRDCVYVNYNNTTSTQFYVTINQNNQFATYYKANGLES